MGRLRDELTTGGASSGGGRGLKPEESNGKRTSVYGGGRDGWVARSTCGGRNAGDPSEVLVAREHGRFPWPFSPRHRAPWYSAGGSESRSADTRVSLTAMPIMASTHWTATGHNMIVVDEVK